MGLGYEIKTESRLWEAWETQHSNIFECHDYFPPIFMSSSNKVPLDVNVKVRPGIMVGLFFKWNF